jgi:hypothetical protein
VVSPRRAAWSLAASAAVAALAALAACTVAGCGGTAAADLDTAASHLDSPADVRAINVALAADQRAIAGYIASGPLLSGDAQHADGWFLGQELSHAGALRSLIAGLDGMAHEPSPAYQFGHPRTEAHVIGLLESLERDQVTATAWAIAHVDSGWIRARLAGILADDAQHLTVLQEERNGLPRRGAFPVGYRVAIAPADAAAFADLLRGELLAVTVMRWSLQSGRLSPPAHALVLYLLAHERAHVQVLAHALGRPVPAAARGLTVDAVLQDMPVRMARPALGRQRGWIDLLETVLWRLEGLLYYDTIPRLSAQDSLLAASILSDEAEHSALIARLSKRGAISTAVPAAMVRGWRLRVRPPW